MIYDGPILDPRHRYYALPPQPNPHNNNPSLSPRERYSKFKSQPVNLSRMNPTNQNQNLNMSNIYTRNGLLKRNDVGWDSVKLSEYVTQQLSQNYLQNQRILEKFRKQAEEQRRRKKFGHAFERFNTAPNQQHSKSGYYLPPIMPISHQLQQQYNPSTNHQSRYIPNLNPQLQLELEQQPHHYRNVGVNTNKSYEKVQLQKYLILREKYDKLKYKYSKEKTVRKYERKLEKQRQLMKEIKEKEINSVSKIREIQNQLTNISVKLEASNSLLAEHLKSVTSNRQKQKQSFNNMPTTESVMKQSKIKTRMKTQPALSLQQQFQQNGSNRSIGKISGRTSGLGQIIIPKNPLDQFKAVNSDLNRKQKNKHPKIVYTKQHVNDFLGDSRFLTKYLRR